MLARNTLLAAAAALAMTATPAFARGIDFGHVATDFLLRLSGRDHDHHRGHHRRPVRVHRDRHYVEGRYECDTVRTWVEGHYDSVYCPAVYRTVSYRDACGHRRTRRVLVTAAHYDRVWRPGYWTTSNVRRWVPGHWVEH